jgi:signal transduction histidine kinase
MQTHQRSVPVNTLGELGLAAAVAHEVRRVLTPVRAYAEMALEDPHLSSDAERALRSLLSAAEEVQGILTDLTAPEFADSDHSLVLGSVHAAIGEWGDANVTGSEDLAVTLSRARLGIVLSNLVGNARRATREGGSISIRVRSTGNTITIEVEDTGVGMTPAQVSRAADPFVSFSASSGLGLAICRYLIQQAGGTLRIRSAPSRGTCVSVELPAAVRRNAKAA